MKRTRKGFTLIELLIVIAILGALTAMMQLSSKGATASAKAAAVRNGLHTIRTAGKMYIAQNSASTLSCSAFNAASKDYLDADIMDGNFSIAAKSDDADTWLAIYTYAASDTSDFKRKLTAFSDVESEDDKATVTIYSAN